MNDSKVVNSKEGAEFLNVAQLSQFLGVSEDTIYSWTMRKFIPHFKIGKLLRFDKAGIIYWLQSRKVEPAKVDISL